MADLKAQVREMASVIEAKQAEAAIAHGELKNLMASAKTEGVDFSKDAAAFEKIDAAGKQYDVAKNELEGIKAKRARLLELMNEDAPAAAKSADADRKAATYGEAFVKSAAYKAAADRAGASANLPIGTTDGVKVADRGELKTLLKVTSGGLSGVPVEDRTDLIVGKPLASLDFLSVIASATTDSDLVEWIEESTYTNSAAETAETDAAAESALAFTVKTAAVKEITHFIPVTRRALNDVAYIESWINNRLIDGVRRRLQTQVLNGGGTGEDLLGIYGTSGIGSVDRSVTATSMLDSLHKAITTVRTNAFVDPDFIGIHPEDFEAIRISKASSAGTYLFGDPVNAGPVTIWGVPVIVHSAFTAGTPLVGKASEASLFIREGVSVAASDSHSDYFVKRQVALLASMRAAFAVTQPKAFAVSVA